MMTDSPPLATFADWSERLKVYGTYIAALAKYKQENAREERAQAEDAGAIGLVRAKSLVIKELETQSRLLHKVRALQDREAAQVAEREQRAMLLVVGRPITGSLAGAWNAYWWFESRALLEAHDELHAVRLTGNALGAENFLDNRDESLLCEGASKRIETALGLAAWMHRHSYLPRPDSAAQQVLVALFQTINGVAQRTLQELSEAIADIRSGAYKPWTCRVVLGISPSAVAARIEAAGANRLVELRADSSHAVAPPHYRPQRPAKPSPRESSPPSPVRANPAPFDSGHEGLP